MHWPRVCIVLHWPRINQYSVILKIFSKCSASFKIRSSMTHSLSKWKATCVTSLVNSFFHFCAVTCSLYFCTNWTEPNYWYQLVIFTTVELIKPLIPRIRYFSNYIEVTQTWFSVWVWYTCSSCFVDVSQFICCLVSHQDENNVEWHHEQRCTRLSAALVPIGIT